MSSSEANVDASASPATRRDWVDLAKGIGILFVVFGHVWRGLREASIPLAEDAYVHVDAAIYSFHMPLFFFLSGLFIERSAKKPWRFFLADKARSLAYPYVVWSLIYGAVSVLMSRYTNSKLSFFDIFPAFLYRPYAHFWFLYVLGLSTLLIFVLLKLGVRVLFIALLALMFYVTPISLDVWPVLYPLRGSLVFVALGAFASGALMTILPSIPRAVAIAAALLLALVPALTTVGGPLKSEVTAFSVALAGTACVVLASRVLDGARGSSVLVTLGRLSLPIYLSHTLATAAARIFLQKALHITSPVVHVGFGMLAGVLLPLALIAAANRLRIPYLFALPAPRPAAALRPAVGD
jgi:fucose 4-O-acetylase-like acetyltransferase